MNKSTILLLALLGGLLVSCADATLGDTRIRPKDGMLMVYVPEGEYLMGSDLDQIRYARELCRAYAGENALSVCSMAVFTNEMPAHPVFVDGFWLDQTEVTNAQYQRCIDEGVCQPPVDFSSSTRTNYFANPRYQNYPIVWVRWDQAVAYCDWAGARLPTEAEWEYAARGPEGFLYPWGDTFDGKKLNYCDFQCESGVRDDTVDDGFADTAPVGSYPQGASWNGALDLAGNVREWVSDWYGHYPEDSQTNPPGPENGSGHIPRGGSWLDTPDDVRSTNRGENTPDYARHKVGFRCAVQGR